MLLEFSENLEVVTGELLKGVLAIWLNHIESPKHGASDNYCKYRMVGSPKNLVRWFRKSCVSFLKLATENRYLPFSVKPLSNFGESIGAHQAWQVTV